MIARGIALALALGSAAAAQPPLVQPPLVQPGAPGQPARTLTPGQSAALAGVALHPADVTFMQEMIGHHAQAVEMVGLMESRTERPDLLMLGRRIAIAQDDEMRMMTTWLARRGQPPPDPHAHHMAGPSMSGPSMPGHDMPGMGAMPGMLTQAQMAALAAAKGPAFERLFLEGMIRHHQGALEMVHALTLQPGAGEDSELFDFAAHVVADQSAEIARMEAMLAATPPADGG